jgi:hypothetical protein
MKGMASKSAMNNPEEKNEKVQMKESGIKRPHLGSKQSELAKRAT